MQVAIIGLPNSGKTTVFNALTGAGVETTTFSSERLEPNVATVKVPDSRVDKLKEIYRPKKLTRADVQYVDIGGLGEAEAREHGLSPDLLHHIGTADALLHVVRAFEDDCVPHPSGSVDIGRDVSAVEAELMLSDLLLIERRLERLEKEKRKVSGSERTQKVFEQGLLGRLKEVLESDQPIRNLDLTVQEEKLLRGYHLLSKKPVLLVLNIDEDRITDPPRFEFLCRRSSVVALSAKVEAELVQLDDDDAREFMESLGISEAARDLVITLSYRLLGLISFLTVGEDEVRAWTIRCGMTAPEAGGVIHSDIQRGFIRAEVTPYERLVTAGTIVAAKKRGWVRLEGKDYVVQDGDISHFLFNV
jgi:GTP-binding protein YchF